MCLSGIDDGEGCREYMCNQCQEEWKKNREELSAARHERDAAIGLAEQRGAAYDIADGLRREVERLTRERDEAIRTVKALTPAANHCLQYKPLLLKAERERDEAVRVLRDIATFGWYAKGAKVARAYLAAREGR